jgi:hypothetical protein
LERYNKDEAGEGETGETYCNVRQEKLELLERYLYYNKTDLVSVRDKISQRLEIRLPCGYGQKQGLVFPLAEKHITF